MDDKINSKFQYGVIYTSINIGFGTVDLHLSVQYANTYSTVIAFIVTNRQQCINSVFLVLMARQQSTAEAKALSTQY